MDGLLGFLPYLFLLFFFFLIPALTRRQRGQELEAAFSRIQKKRKSRIIAIVHRQEPMGLLGIPILKYIDLNDAEDVLEAVRTTPPNQPLELILHTPGGLVLPALQIARAVKAHPAKVTVYVPHYAMSGGTLIALAADEIVLNKHAVLGPIDPQIGGLPAASLVRLTENKSIDSTNDQTLILADIGRMAIQQLERAARELLSGTVSDNAAVAAAELLSSGRWTHDYPIESAEAQEIGLNVSTNMPDDIVELMRLFPDRLSKTSVKFYAPAIFGGRREKERRPEERDEAPFSERQPFTGYQPGPGSRSYSYGPWNPRDIPDLIPPGPSAYDIRRRGDRRR
jgi:ClpP class serine protease